MVDVTVKNRAGEELTIDAAPGRSLMESLRGGGIDELEALCGGTCSCATCHVYLDAASFALFAHPGAFEEELLDNSEYRTTGSRLSCQLEIADGMHTLRVTIAPAD